MPPKIMTECGNLILQGFNLSIKYFCVSIEVLPLLGKVGFGKVILRVIGNFLSLST